MSLICQQTSVWEMQELRIRILFLLNRLKLIKINSEANRTHWFSFSYTDCRFLKLFGIYWICQQNFNATLGVFLVWYFKFYKDDNHITSAKEFKKVCWPNLKYLYISNNGIIKTRTKYQMEKQFQQYLLPTYKKFTLNG